jgi:hypothetical protein
MAKLKGLRELFEVYDNAQPKEVASLVVFGSILVQY